MKLKNITLIALGLFACFFLALALFENNQMFKDFFSVMSAIPNTNNPANTEIFGISRAEVAKHNTPKDCYLIVGDSVYSVSSFINAHPGGTENISSGCGKDVTKEFNDIHSSEAKSLLKNFYLAKVASN